MVLTTAQTTAFFEDATRIAIPHNTVVQLQVEEIDTVYDLLDFDKDALDQVANNLRRPGGGAAAFVFGAKSQKILLAATKLIRFYFIVGRNITAPNI